MMPRTKAHQEGHDFESYVAKVLDGHKQPGSGNQFHSKSDVLAHGLLLSAKNQSSFTWTEIKRYLDQSIEYSQGTGNIPALALNDKIFGDPVVIMRLSDLAKAFQGGVTNIPEYFDSKGIKKRNEANIPVMLRE